MTDKKKIITYNQSLDLLLCSEFKKKIGTLCIKSINKLSILYNIIIPIVCQ